MSPLLVYICCVFFFWFYWHRILMANYICQGNMTTYFVMYVGVRKSCCNVLWVACGFNFQYKKYGNDNDISHRGSCIQNFMWSGICWFLETASTFVISCLRLYLDLVIFFWNSWNKDIPEGLWVNLTQTTVGSPWRRLVYKLLTSVQHYTLNICYLVYKLPVKLIIRLY